MTKAFIGVIGAAAVLFASSSIAQTARDIRGPAAVVPLAAEPPPRIVVDAPLAEWLAQGRVVIQYRTENLRIVPVFGPNALDVSPRIGHIHVTVDDGPLLGRRQQRAAHHQLSSPGAAQGPDRAREREPPDAR